MESVQHYWNITKYLLNYNNSEVNELRNHYIQCCRELSEDIELPKTLFGTNTLCPHCGSFWNAVDCKTKINKGKNPSKSVKKLINKYNKSNSNLSRYQQKLAKKCIKNQSNQLNRMCSHCHKTTEVSLNKSEKHKIKKIKIETVKTTSSKKKKRNKDKTAGLILNPTSNAVLKPIVQNDSKTKHRPLIVPKSLIIKKPNNSAKKVNVSKLKGIVNASILPPKKTNLHSFLSQLGT